MPRHGLAAPRSSSPINLWTTLPPHANFTTTSAAVFDRRALLDSISVHTIVRSSIELGHSLGLRVVAEGVERTDHFGFLAAAGCDVAQGYVISFPQPPEALDLDAIDRASTPMLADRDPLDARSHRSDGDLAVHRR